MALTAALKNIGLDAMAAEVTYLGLATAAGVELTGSPYARKPVTWGSASNGTVTSASPVTFDVPGDSTVARVIYRDAETDGTDLGYGLLSEAESYAGDGTLTVSSIALNLTDPT